jgi:hypothetical protein
VAAWEPGPGVQSSLPAWEGDKCWGPQYAPTLAAGDLGGGAVLPQLPATLEGKAFPGPWSGASSSQFSHLHSNKP